MRVTELGSKTFNLFSSFFERVHKEIKVGKISFFSQYEFGSGELDPQKYLVFESGISDLVKIEAKDLARLTVFAPREATKLLKLESNGKALPFFTPVEFSGELKISVFHKTSGEFGAFVPLLYLIESEESTMVKLIPTLIPEKTMGWLFPIYHFRHAMSREYLIPFLWERYPRKYEHLFDLPLPFPRRYIERDSHLIQEGLFYWIPHAREEWSRTMLAYNFTGELEELILIYTQDHKRRKFRVPPDSKIFLEADKPDIIIAIGSYRLEWFPLTV